MADITNSHYSNRMTNSGQNIWNQKVFMSYVLRMKKSFSN